MTAQNSPTVGSTILADIWSRGLGIGGDMTATAVLTSPSGCGVQRRQCL